MELGFAPRRASHRLDIAVVWRIVGGPIFGFNARTSSQKWSVLPGKEGGSGVIAAAVLSDETFYVAISASMPTGAGTFRPVDASLVALNVQDGAEKWRKRSSEGIDGLALGEGGLYAKVYSETGCSLQVFAAATGEPELPILVAPPGLCWASNSGPAVVEGKAFVAAGSTMYAVEVGAGTSNLEWSFTFPGQGMISPPAISQGTMFVVDQDGTVFAFDAATGPDAVTDPSKMDAEGERRSTGYFFIHGICSLGEMWTQSGANGYPVWDALTKDGAGGRKPNMAPTYGPVDASQTPAQVARLLQVRLDEFMDRGGNGGTPVERVVLIGHSNGGLMARLLLESETSEGRGDRIERVVTLDSPDRGADQSHFSYNVIQSHLRALFGTPPCTTPWAEWSRAFEDQNTGDTSWIGDLPAPELSGGRLIRFLFGDCSSGIGAVENQKGTAFTERLAGPTCRNGNQIVNSNAANPSGALLLSPARASASDDEAAVRDACLTSQRGIGAVALNVDDPGAYTGFSNMIDVHSEGVRYFADYIVPTVQSGLVGFYSVQGAHDCSVLSKFPEGTVAGAAAFLASDTGLTIIGQANPYLDGFTMATSVSGDTLVLDVFSPQEEGKIVVVNAEAAVWPTKDLADLGVSIDGHPLKRAGTVAELQEQVAAQADQGMYFADRIDPTSLQFLVYVPSFSEHTIEIGRVADQPFLTRFGIAVLAVAVLSIGLVAYAIGRRQGRKGT